MDRDEVLRLWAQFPEMSEEEFIAFLKTHKDHSDTDNMYKYENNEAP